MTTKGSNNPFPSLLMVEGDPEALASNPAVGQRRLAVGTDHLLYLVDDAGVATLVGSGSGDVATDAIWNVKGDLAVGTGADTAARLAAGSNDTILMADSGQTTGLKWVASQTPSTQAFSDAAAEGTADTFARGDHKHGMPASPSATDPITAVFGAADTAYEFDTSSLTGLTAMGTPDAEAAHTTIPGHYYIADNAGGTAWCGRYQSIPSYSFTAMCKISDANVQLNYNAAALFLGVSTPGKLSVLEWASNSRTIRHEIFTNPTTFSSAVNNTSFAERPSLYLAVVATSTSNTTWYYSMNGYVWQRVSNAHDPSMTIGSVGIAIKSENTAGFAAAFDFLRIWNSAKTFYTGI